MSLLLAGLVSAGVATALAVSRWMARSKSDQLPRTEPAPPVAAKPAQPALEGFPCQVGDVILGTANEEAWLAGALVFTEGVPVAALFVAPDAGGDRGIFVTPAPSPSLAWLSALDPGAVVVGGEPPTAVELDDVRYERTRRRPLRVAGHGVTALDVGDSAVLAEYAAAGSERLLVILGPKRTLAFRGEALGEGRYEVIPSGRTTLEEPVTAPASS